MKFWGSVSNRIRDFKLLVVAYKQCIHFTEPSHIHPIEMDPRSLGNAFHCIYDSIEIECVVILLQSLLF